MTFENPTNIKAPQEAIADRLNEWLVTLDPQEKKRAQNLWIIVHEKIRQGKDDEARLLLEQAQFKLPLTVQEIIQFVQSTRQTYEKYWLDADSARGYTEGARKDDGTIDILHRLVSEQPHIFAVPKGSNVIELGSGTGLALSAILPAISDSAKIYGMDISPAMLQENQIKERYEALVEHDLVRGIPAGYRDKRFELAFAAGVFQYLSPETLEKVLSELGNVISENGRLIFSIGSTAAEKSWLDHPAVTDAGGQKVGIIVSEFGPSMYYYNETYVNALLNRYGFIIIKSQFYPLSKRAKATEEKQPSQFIIARKDKMAL